VATIHYQTATSQQRRFLQFQQKYYCGQSTLLGHSQTLPSWQVDEYLDDLVQDQWRIQDPIDELLRPTHKPPKRSWDFNEGWFAEPVFLTGDYPATLKAYTSTFLRNFTQAEMQAINGSADIFAHDAYTSSFYYAPDYGKA
jgi:hypothetical protein